MTHVRTQARKAMSARLMALPLFKKHVHQSRTRRVAAADLPEVLVYTGDEAVDMAGVNHPRALVRRCIIYVEAIDRAKASEAIDDLLDSHCAQIERAIAADVSLGGTVKDCRLVRSEFDFDGESEAEFGVVRLQYEVAYVTPENDPETLR